MKRVFHFAFTLALFSTPLASHAYASMDSSVLGNVATQQAKWTRQFAKVGKACLQNWDRHLLDYSRFVEELNSQAFQLRQDLATVESENVEISFPSLRLSNACDQTGKELSERVGKHLRTLSDGMNILDKNRIQLEDLVKRGTEEIAKTTATDVVRSWSCVWSSSYTDLADAAIRTFAQDSNSYADQSRREPNGFRLMERIIENQYGELYQKNEQLVKYATSLQALQSHCGK